MYLWKSDGIKRYRQPNNKMSKDLDGQFSKEDTQLVNKHVLSGGNICHSKVYLLDMRINSGWFFQVDNLVQLLLLSSTLTSCSDTFFLNEVFADNEEGCSWWTIGGNEVNMIQCLYYDSGQIWDFTSVNLLIIISLCPILNQSTGAVNKTSWFY